MEMISITSYCLKNGIENSFVEYLAEGGLIEIIWSGEERFIPYSVLPQLEKYIRWHYDLEINPPGIETVQYLLYKIELLKEEVAALKNKLNIYENHAS